MTKSETASGRPVSARFRSFAPPNYPRWKAFLQKIGADPAQFAHIEFNPALPDAAKPTRAFDDLEQLELRGELS